MRKVRNALAIVFGFLTLGGAAAWFTVRPWWHRWGVDPAEAGRALPGDDVVPDAPIVDTRSIAIAAPVEAVWPWLVQMGFGRAGWYSYDAIDMRGSSAEHVLGDQQELVVGGIVPTHPDGGFEVKVLEPEHALVLYMDAAMARDQAAAAKAARQSSDGGDTTPVNLQAAGGLFAGTQPGEFKVSWAFVLEPEGEHGSRLIERTRFSIAGGDRRWTTTAMPFMGFGVFVMIRKQLLGIRERVQAAAAAA